MNLTVYTYYNYVHTTINEVKPSEFIGIVKGSINPDLEGRCPAKFSFSPNQRLVSKLIKVFRV